MFIVIRDPLRVQTETETKKFLKTTTKNKLKLKPHWPIVE